MKFHFPYWVIWQEKWPFKIYFFYSMWIKRKNNRWSNGQNINTMSPVNLAQLVALDNHSRLSRRNWSLVVPECMNELAITVAVWQTEFRTASLMFFNIIRSALLLRIRNWRWRLIVVAPPRIALSLVIRSWMARSLSLRSSSFGAGGVDGAGAVVWSVSSVIERNAPI